jgi:DNA-binding Lrp family transcriptional regulator
MFGQMKPESPEEKWNRLQQLVQEGIAKAYANPERSGCVNGDAIRELATRAAAFDDSIEEDPDWKHVTHCSPCFQEFLELRNEFVANRARLVRRNRIVLASALVVAGIVGAVIWRGASRPIAPITTAEATSQVDMRPFSVTRGESNNPQQSEKYAGVLSRNRVRLSIILPVGAEEGTYEVRLMDNDLKQVIASGKAPASFADHTLRLAITFDLTDVPPGPYEIASRRDGGGWMTSPVLIK